MVGLVVLFVISALALTYAVPVKDENDDNPVLKDALTVAQSNNSSDPLEVLTANPNFQRHSLICQEAKDAFKIDRKKAIELAISQQNGGRLKTTKKVTAIKTILTDPTDLSPNAPRNRPVWIVTFHETEVQRPGFTEPRIGDIDVVLDGNTGEWQSNYYYNHS